MSCGWLQKAASSLQNYCVEQNNIYSHLLIERDLVFGKGITRKNQIMFTQRSFSENDKKPFQQGRLMRQTGRPGQMR
jgi:hypothetical protein